MMSLSPAPPNHLVCRNMIAKLRAYEATRRCALFQDESVLRPTETFTVVGYPARLPRCDLVFQFSQGSQVYQ